MAPAHLGVILDSSVIIASERKRQTVEELLTSIRATFGEIEIAISAVTVAELVHGVVRAHTAEIRRRRRNFIDELKKHVLVHPTTDDTAEIAGGRPVHRRISARARLCRGYSQYSPL
jgi:tRNA(fMet)-specific endonuclease VapC